MLISFLADFAASPEAAQPSSLGAFLIVIIIASFLIGAALYFIPTFIAFARRHSNKAAILLLNIFLGWTFVGWVVALVWSATKSNSTPPIVQ